MSVKLLEMKGISKHFPGVKALDDVNFSLEASEVHALLGENGAGKSTLIKVLGGIYSIDSGEIFIDGKKVFINQVKDAQACGIGIIHQELVLVPQMTIAENIYLGKELTGKAGLINKSSMIEQAQKMLDKFGLHFQADRLVSDLSTAQQQMVEIIKAVSFNARILVMDEPTSSLSDKEVDFLFETIRNLKSMGVGIIYISHRLSELLTISDRVTVLRDGQYIGTEITKNTTPNKLVSMMVGRELTNYYTRTYNESSETVLKVKDLTRKGVIENVGFEVRKGEILGFSGLVGAGRSEAMRAIFGVDPIDSGSIYLDGKKLTIKHPVDAIQAGIVLVPESRKSEALFPIQSVRYNISIEVLRHFINNLRVNKDFEEGLVNKYIDMLSIRTPSIEQYIGNLSGGNQQKTVIARWLATKPKILILDEPTRGVDVGAKAEIYAIMNALAAQGVAIIMISSELPEVINMSDRIVVMAAGRVTGILERGDLTQEKIMTLATEGL